MIILNKYLLPKFANQALFMIEKSDILAFRASLGKVTHKTNTSCQLPELTQSWQLCT